MYDYFNGTFTYKSNTKKGLYATLEVGGVGYNIELMERDFINLPEQYNTLLKIYIVLMHREDKMSLCGFLKREDRDIFNILLSVSGVGSKMALMLLNNFEVSELVGLVLDEDYKALTKAKGVGPKLAQKIILELKDKLTVYSTELPLNSNTKDTVSSTPEIEDAKAVLLSLGYSIDEITKVFKSVNMENLTAEEILKSSLVKLSS